VPDLPEVIQALPKVELHVHLEGTVQPETLFDLSRRNGIALPVHSLSELRTWYTFRNFDHFVEIFSTLCACLRTPDDFARITYEYGQAMAQQNIRYAEITWSPTQHSHLPFTAILDGVNEGRRRAEQDFGVRMAWIPDIVRCYPETAAQVVAWLISPQALQGGVVAIGLGGPEVGFPPELFAEAFAEARAAGLHSNPHAGETVGPESVWGALRALGAERIGHGVRAIEDPALVAHLAAQQIPLEVNPTSNICLGVYRSYAEHPLRALVEAGLCVTINSDDPALFNTTLSQEYLHAAQDCGLNLEQLATVARNAIRASYLPEGQKASLLAEFDSVCGELGLDYDG